MSNGYGNKFKKNRSYPTVISTSVTRLSHKRQPAAAPRGQSYGQICGRPLSHGRRVHSFVVALIYPQPCTTMHPPVVTGNFEFLPIGGAAPVEMRSKLPWIRPAADEKRPSQNKGFATVLMVSLLLSNRRPADGKEWYLPPNRGNVCAVPQSSYRYRHR